MTRNFKINFGTICFFTSSIFMSIRIRLFSTNTSFCKVINTTVWTGSPGDFFEFDGNPFGEMILAELTNPEEGDFDRATINAISSIHVEILGDQYCSFDGSPVICHVSTQTVEVNLTGYDDEQNTQLDYEFSQDTIS